MTVQADERARHDVDAIVVGAGFAGLRMLHELRMLGLSARVFEAGSGVGGTWFWNRYPGARTDSESWYYTSFSNARDLAEEWTWTERYPSQSQVLAYLEHVTERLDLRRHIEFDTRIASARYRAETNRWEVTTDAGETFTCRYFITAVGCLSATYRPPFDGLDDFTGEWFETSRWPADRTIDFTGKPVALIGTGATGVQLAPMIAHTAGQLTVFQRTPNYVLPARNRNLSDDERAELRANAEAIWQRAQAHPFGMDYPATGVAVPEVSPEEQTRLLEAAWERGGFSLIFSTFTDLLTDESSNHVAAEFVRNKIRSIVKDPATAELLCPTTYPLVGKRPPLGHGYYEIFNRDNVALVDVSNDPITRITATGLRTDQRAFDADVIVFATGFDALTGSITRMDISGRSGASIEQRWAAGPETYLGIGVDDFPNLFMITGPQSPFANIPVVIETVVEWIGNAVAHLRDHGKEVIEPTPDAVRRWGLHMDEMLNATILPAGRGANAWHLGANIPGKAQVIQVYLGGIPAYRDEIQLAADKDYEGFVLA
jgi:cation diffusion facilitator CzcD-associated flavoprotein CzcO